MVGWHHRVNGHELSKLWEILKDSKPGMLESMESQRVKHDLATIFLK